MIRDNEETGVSVHVYEVRIGDDVAFNHNISFEDPVPTGRQILQRAEQRPPSEYQLLMLTRDGRLEEVDLDETVDLRGPEIEQFLVFKTDRLFYFVIDERRFPWGGPTIKESTLKFLAGVADDYTVWQERRGAQDDLRIEPGTSASLESKGVETFFTGKDQTNAGDGIGILPKADQRYVAERGLVIEAHADGTQKGLVIRGFRLPPNLFQVETADLLVLLPPAYPDVPPDMFYADPWLRLRNGDRLPDRADQPHTFAGRNWQRWSRHNDQWRPSVDGLRTFLQRINTALENAQ